MSKKLKKRCTGCGKMKEEFVDFYLSCGPYYRSECKKCTIKRNIAYQKRIRARLKAADPNRRKIYMRAYYAKNAERYQKYRDEFNKKYPHYFRDWYRNKKRSQMNESVQTITLGTISEISP